MTMLLTTPSGSTYTALEMAAMLRRLNSPRPKSSRYYRRR